MTESPGQLIYCRVIVGYTPNIGLCINFTHEPICAVMAPINAALNGSKDFSPAKKSLPEVDTEGGNGNGTKG